MVGGVARIRLHRGQHRRIVQVDESALEDGDLGARQSILSDPSIPQVTESSKESAPHTSIFTSSTSCGEYVHEYAQAGPCQTIFQSDAESTENFRVKKSWCTGPCDDNMLPEVTGIWDNAGTQVTIGAQVVVTPKGGTVT